MERKQTIMKSENKEQTIISKKRVKHKQQFLIKSGEEWVAFLMKSVQTIRMCVVGVSECQGNK